MNSILRSSDNLVSKYTSMGKKSFTLNRNVFGAVLAIGLLLTSVFNVNAQSGSKKLTDQQVGQVMGGNSSISFIENKGQWPDNILFRADMPGAQMLATPQGMLVGMFDPASLAAASAYGDKLEALNKHPEMSRADLGPVPVVKGHGWRFNFVGGNLANAQSLEKKGQSDDFYNYLSADPAKNATNVYSYNELTYKNVYAGIDVKYYTSSAGDLENDITVQPGVDANQIKIQIEGITALKLNGKGEIVLPTTLGEFTVPSPVSYLVDKDGKRTSINIKYRLTGNNTLVFDIPAYDKSKTLVIDPIVMRWATMISQNATADSHCHGVDVDASGYIYVTGKYEGGLIVTTGAFQTTDAGNYDLFIGKYQEPTTPGQSGTRVWQTYLGTSASDNPYALDAGADGNIYIGVNTSGTFAKTYGTGFTAGSWTQYSGSTGQQIAIVKVNPTGTGALVREFGSNTSNLNLNVFDMRIQPNTSSSFNIIVSGFVTQKTTADGDVPAPVTPAGAAITTGSGTNGLIFSLTNNLTSNWAKEYGTGVTNAVNEFNIAVTDNSGNVIVGGLTKSNTNISYNNPSGQTGLVGTQDGWLMSLNASSGVANWSRYYNAASGKSADILCMETNTAKTQFFVGGITTGLTSGVNITTGAYQTTYGGGTNDFFIGSLAINGSATTWGTYVGGSSNEVNMMGLNVDLNNDVYVLGYSTSKDFPAVDFPVQSATEDGSKEDAVFFKLTGSTGATMQYSTYLGGNGDQASDDPVGERGIRFNNCRIYLAITTESPTFPLTQGTLNAIKHSSTSNDEPILVSMANPPDLNGNSITGGNNQTITCGQTPQPITAGIATYVIPNIIRDSVLVANGSAGAYPSGLPPITNYQWQYSNNGGITWTSISGATGQNYTPTIIDSFIGTFKFRRIVNNDACNLSSDTLAVVSIIVTPPFAAPAITTNSPLCVGQTLNLSTPAQSGFTYAWSGPNSFSSTSQTPSVANVTSAAAGTYKLIVTKSSNGCPSYPDSVPVVVNTALPAPTAGSNSPVCTGGTISLTASGTGTTFSWTGPNSYTSSTQNPNITNATSANAGSYLVTQSNGGSCASPATAVSVTVNTIASPTNVSASPNPICTGNTLTLTATALSGDTLKWTFPDGGTATGSPVVRTNVTTAMGGSYSVYQKSSSGCTSTPATVTVTVNQTPPAPTFVASPNPICTGNTLTLTATGQSGATFTWTTPGGGTPTNNPLVIANVTSAAAGNYSVTQTANGCTSPSSANTNVVVNPTPVISSANGTSPTTCGGTNGFIILSGLTSGSSYTVTYVLSGNTVNAGSLTANGSGQVTIPNLGTGSYSNIIVTLTGCPSAPFAGPVVLLNPTTPSAPGVSNNGPICSGTGDTIKLFATGQAGATYSWTNVARGFTSALQNPIVSGAATTGMSGSYCATQTVAGCTSPSACTTVEVDTTPHATFTTSSNPTTCGGTNGSITLSGLTSGQTYAVTYSENGTAAGPVSLVANGSGQVILTGLNAGSYTNIVLKLNTCSSSPVAGPIVLSNPSNPSAPVVSSNSPDCSGSTINLRGTGQAGAVFSWTGPLTYTSSVDSPNIANATVSMSGSYCATQTVAGCTSPSACTPVIVHQTPSITSSTKTNPTTCNGTNGSITLIGLSNSTSYSVTYTFNATAVGPLTISSNGSGQLTLPNLAAGSYTNIIVSDSGCSSSPLNGITLTGPAIPNAPTVSSNSPVCSGNPLTLLATTTVTGVVTYSWTGPNTYTSTLANPTVSNLATTGLSGSYCATQTDSGCTSLPACVTVVVNPTPTATAGPVGGSTICSGLTDTLGGHPTAANGTAPYNYSWSSGASSIANPVVSPIATTTYVLTVSDSKNCSATSTTTVTVHTSPIASAGNSVTLPACSPTGIQIGGSPTGSGGSGSYTYAWNPTTGLTPTNGANPTVQGITSTTTYTVTVTDGSSCSASSQVVVTVTNNPPSTSITPGSTETWCAGTSSNVNLTAQTSGGTTPYTYAWSGSNITPTNQQLTNANPSLAGVYTYTVTVTDAFHCTSTATTTVTVDTLPKATAGPVGGFKLCNGSNITIGGSPTASGGTSPYTYAWSGSASPISNPTVNPTINTIYNVTVTDHNGCSASASANVVVNPTPSANAGSDQSMTACNLTGVSIGGSPTGSGGTAPLKYTWTPNAGLSFDTVSNPTVKGIGSTTTYTVVVSDANSCTASDQVVVNITGSTLQVSILPNTSLFWCAGSGGQVTFTALALNGTPPYTIGWTGYHLSADTGIYTTVNPDTAALYTYSVKVTDATGCTTGNSIQVRVFPQVYANAGPSVDSVCNGVTVALGSNPTASGGTTPYTYSWTNGASSVANPSVHPLTTTTYTVLVTDSNNCTASASSTVAIRANPVADAGADQSLPTCSPSGIKIGGSPTASGGTPTYSYSWSPSVDLSATNTSNPTVTHLLADTTYTVVVTDKNGCTASDQVRITSVNKTPLVSIVPSAKAEYCSNSGSSLNLVANVSSGSPSFVYNWSGTSITPQNAASATVNPALPGAYSYTVTVTDAFNCTATASQTVTVDTLPSADAGLASHIVCAGTAVTLGGNPTASGGKTPYTYLWTNGAAPVASPTVTPLSTTTYTLLVTDSNGCTATANSTVTVNPNPTANAGSNQTLPTCSPTGVQIGGTPTANGGGGAPYTYTWSPSTDLFSDSSVSNPQVIGLTSTTIYTVVVKDVNSCSATASVRVTVTNNAPTVTISSSNTPEWCAGTNSSSNLTANVTDPSPVIAYNWSGTNISPTNALTATVNPNTSGSYNYTVTVTDSYNCTASATKTVIVDSVPVANAGANAVLCFGFTDTLGGTPTASKGNPSYTYVWSNGAGTTANPVITPSSSAVYVVTVTDSKSCTATASASITVRNTPVASAGTSPITLPACSPTGIQIGGSPTASAGSGGPYTYAWSPKAGLSDSTVANPVVAGINSNTTYTVTVTDLSGCTATAQVTVNVTHTPPVATITSSGTSHWCSGSNTSVTLTASISGGSTPFAYSWTGTNISPTNGAAASVNPSTPGSYIYTVTVRDGFNCTTTASDTIKVDSLPTANAGGGVSSSFIICGGSSAVIGGSPTATGGVKPYSYAWNNGASPVANPTVSPLTTTTYTVTITDSVGCTATAASTVIVRTNPIASAGSNQTLQTCSPSGVTIGGSPTASGGGGAPFTYHWSPVTGLSDSLGANPVVLGIVSNTLYTVKITDANGCTASSSVLITVSNSGPSVSISASGNTEWCSNTGSSVNLTANVVNGTAASYLWSGTSISPINSNVAAVNPQAAGSYLYTVLVTETNGCTASATKTINVDSLPAANAGTSGFFVCAGNSVVLGGHPVASGGTAPYTYVWNGGAAPDSTPTVSPQISTTYILTVTDSHGCTATSAATVNVRPTPTANAGPDQNITTCPQDSLTLGGSPSAFGGTSPYTYTWSPRTGLSDSTKANPVVKGITTTQTYTLLVTDANGCSGTDIVVIRVVSSTLQANIGSNKQVCSGPNGCIQLGGLPSVFGGTGPYVFSWSQQASLDNPSSSNPIACPDTTTTYTVTITDSKGCSVTAAQTVSNNPTPVVNAGNDTSLCQGSSIKIGGNPTASGGTGTYTYSWSPSQGLSAPATANPLANPTTITTYTVSVTDSKGCTATDDITLTPHTNPVVNAGPDKTMTSCPRDTSVLGGLPDVTGGGTPPYIYHWIPGTNLSDTASSAPYVTGLLTTTSYELIVVDSNGCQGNDFVVVNVVPSTLQAQAGNDKAICANTTSPAQLGGTPTAVGGAAPYVYTWSPALGLSDSTRPNPLANPTVTTAYVLKITDSKGCTSTDTVKVTVNPLPVVSAGTDTAVCYGNSVNIGGSPTATSGTPAYHYSWNPTSGLSSNSIANPVATPQSTTIYIVTVTDANSCQATGSVKITVNPNPVAVAGPTGGLQVGTCAFDSVQLGGTPAATGGTPGYTYVWSPNLDISNDSVANPYVKGLTTNTIYGLTVTDVNGCSANAQVFVRIVPTNLTAEAGNGGAYCAGSGSLVVLGGAPTAVGGTAGYTYQWSPADSLSATNVANPVAHPTVTTKYFVTVTDSKGCSAVDSTTVTVRPVPVVVAGTDTTLCAGNSVTLGGQPTASGGAGTFAYHWSPGNGISSIVASNPVATPTSSTTYTVTVTDKVGCSASASVNVGVRANPVANAGPDRSLVACSADSVRLGGSPSATGGTAPYTYSWTTTAGLSCSTCANPYASHLGANTTYDLVVTDTFGCSAFDQVNVSVTGSSLVAHAGNSVSFCHGTSVSVTLGGNPTASGGTPAYTYAWAPALGLNDSTSPNPLASPTVTTKYGVVVTDANGCKASDTVIITINPAPVVQAGADDTICAGSQVLIGGAPTASGGTGNSYTYNWAPPTDINSITIANPTVSPTMTTTYVVTVTDSIGCTNTGKVVITVHINPIAQAANPQTVVSCPNACVNVGGSPTAHSGTAPYFYAWSPSAGLNNTGLANPSACNLSTPVTYVVTVTDINGCTATAQTSVNVVASTLLADAGNDKSICQGQSTGVVIGGSPAVSGGTSPYAIIWSPATGITNSTTIANPTAKPTDTTTYVLFVEDALGCVSVDSMTLFVTPAVVVTLNADTAICFGGNTIIGGSPTASGGTAPLSYSWSPGFGLLSTTAANPIARPTGTSTYCVTVTDSVGCSASACQTVTVNPAIVACAGPIGGYTMTNCSGSFVTLGCRPTAYGGSGNYSYAWAPDSVGGVQVLNSSTISNPVVSGLATTTVFTLTVTDNVTGCTSTAQVQVVVNTTTLTANAGGNKLYCANSSTCVPIGGNPTATGGASPYIYQWSPGTNINNTGISNPCVKPVSTTTYYLTVTDQLGCSQVDSAVITVSPFITVYAGADTAICYGQSVVLGANPLTSGGTGNFTYSWSPSQNLTSTVIAHPTAQNLTGNITYTLNATDSFGCSASGIVNIAVRPLPVANAGPSATIFACALDSAVLGGNPTASGTVGPYTYSWSPPFDSSLNCHNCANPVVRNLGHLTQFCVTVTDTFGCQATSCTQVTVLPNTVFVNAGRANAPSICGNVVGSCVTIGGNPAVTGGVPPYTYEWFGNNISAPTASNPIVCPDTTSNYLLIGTDSKGCQAADSVTVKVNNPPVVSITGLDTAYCVNAGNVIMTGTPSGGTFSGPGVTGNVFQPQAVGVGTWCVQYAYTDPLTGCKGDTIICVHVNAQPVVTISGYPSTNFCKFDAPDTLIGSPAGGVFSGPGMVGNVFYPANAPIGNSTITYTYNNGCTNSTSVVFNVKGNPTISLSVSTDTFCTGVPVTITPTFSFDVFNIIYNKLGGGVVATGLSPVTIQPTGNYYCVVASAINTPNGCVTRDTLCMNAILPPVINTDTTHTCEQLPVTIDLGAEVSDPNGNGNIDTIRVLGGAAHGTVILTSAHTYTYTPTNYYYGVDSFKFVACNEQCTHTCDTATQYVAICFTHYPPVIVDTTVIIYTGDTAHVCPYIYDVNNFSLTIGNANCSILNGTLTFTSDSCLSFVPNLNYVGTQTICVTVCDSIGGCDTGQIHIIVKPRNVPPIAYRINVTECSSAPIGVNIASATVDPHGQLMTYNYGSISGNPGATWTITGNGAGVFTATTPGTYTMPYYVCNHGVDPIFSLCDSNVVVVTVVNCNTTPNDSIKANNDGATTTESVPVVVNELANDYYPDSASLTVTIVSGPILPGATATLNADGTITYVSPVPGIDTIVYQICDPSPLCSTASIIIFVDSTVIFNYPPVAVNDFDSTNYIAPVIVPVLNNDYDNNGDSIVNSGIVTPPTNGTATVNPNGTVTYNPNPNATTTDTFTYRTCDYAMPTLCDTATVVIYIRPFNVPPVAFPQKVSVCENTSIGIDVAASTVDPHGNPMTYSYGTISGPAGATLVVTGNGALVFSAPSPGVYTIPYTVCNHSTQPVNSLCATSYVTVDVINCRTIPNDSIFANNDGVVTTVGVSTVINELANDYYPTPGSLTVTVLQGPGLAGATYVINADGTITYNSPTPGYDSIVYRICDPSPLCATATIYIYVDTTPVIVTNYPPVAVDDFDSTDYLTPIVVPVLSNDYSNNGDSIYVTGITQQPDSGTAVLNPNGTITYTPTGQPGTSDTFDYRICDYNAPTLCDTAQVVIYIRDYNVPPIALPQTYYTCKTQFTGVDVAGSTTDPHGNPLTYIYGVVSPVGGHYAITGTGALDFWANTPGTYTIPYTVCNHSALALPSLCASSVITIVVTNCDSIVNNGDSIKANPDGVVTSINTPTVINELGNDYYPNHDSSLTVTVLVGPHIPGATYVINADGSITYTSPIAGYDSIVYQICDPAPLCSTATIYIYVDSLPNVVTNYPPVAVDDYDSTNYNTPVIVPVLNNDYSNNGDSIILTAIPCSPDLGTAVMNANGTITYTPGYNAYHTDTFCYQICDAVHPGLCDTAKVVIYIRPVKLPPLAFKINLTTCKTQSVGIDVAGATVDPLGLSLNYTYGVPTGPGVATVSITGNGALVFAAATPGLYVIPYTVCNTDPLCASSYITVDVFNCPTIPNDSIQANDDGVVTHTNTPTVINELNNDFYPNPGALVITILQGPSLPGATFVVNANGTITYNSPVTGVDSIVYQICDPVPLCSTATIYIYVDSTNIPIVNYPPVAVNDFDSTDIGTPVVIPVLSNDYSPNGQPIQVTAIPCSPDQGTASISPGGTITYIPAPGISGTDTFCYKICNVGSNVLCDTAQVVVYIRPIPFVLANDTEYVCSIDTINMSVLNKASEQPGEVLHITGVGAVTPNNLGNVSFTDSIITFHANGTQGTARFNYYACDNAPRQHCDTASVTVFIGFCPLPVIHIIIDTTLENTPDTVCVGPYVQSTTPWHISSFCDPQNGTVTANSGDTCFTYVPSHNFVGNDTFCIVICNANGCDTGTVIITVIDSTIKAVPESCDRDTMNANSKLVIDVLGNDIIPAAKDTVVTVSVAPVNGGAEVNPDNTITYTPNKGYEGIEQFTYQVCAETGGYKFCDTADVCVTVTGPCFIPNAFSPNGDGQNDTYVIPCNDKYPNASVKIFSRWGMEVWSSSGHYLNDFDGHDKQNQILPDGTYYVIYEYNDGSGKSEAKFVVITR